MKWVFSPTVRLSELLTQEKFKAAGICVIGHYKTDANTYAVLGRSGQPVFPPPKIYHLVRIASETDDPEIEPEDFASILRRFEFEKHEHRL